MEQSTTEIWLFLILCSVIISLRGYRRIKENERRKRGIK